MYIDYAPSFAEAVSAEHTSSFVDASPTEHNMHASGPDPPVNNRSDLEWFDERDYARIVGKNDIRYIHSTAGRVLGKSETLWEKRWKERQELHPNDAYHPFPSLAQWRLAYWLSTCKASQSKIDEFLAIDGVCTHILFP